METHGFPWSGYVKTMFFHGRPWFSIMYAHITNFSVNVFLITEIISILNHDEHCVNISFILNTYTNTL